MSNKYEWVDATSYSQADKERKPSMYRLKIDGCKIKITVHKYVGSGDAIYLTVKDVGIDMFNLNTTDFDVAKSKALTVLRDSLIKKAEAYMRLADILNEVE